MSCIVLIGTLNRVQSVSPVCSVIHVQYYDQLCFFADVNM